MRSYTITKVNDALDWNKIPVMPIDTLLWTDSVDLSAVAQICWDEENLYVRMEAVEPNIRMEEEGPLAMVCLDSCLEFFFQPTSREEYFNFEINPKGAVWLGHGRDPASLIRLLPLGGYGMFDIRTELTDTGWVLTYRIPFAFIRQFFPEFTAGEGVRMRGNAYKCGDKTAKPHFLAWNPIDLPNPAFHCPAFYGELVFGG